MKLDFKINHMATLDNPFPSDLKIGSYMIGKSFPLLRLHNAVCIIQQTNTRHEHYWAMFFEPVNSNWSALASWTTLSAYQGYISDYILSSNIRWLSNRQNPNAIVASGVGNFDKKIFDNLMHITYKPELYDEVWYSDDTLVSEFNFLPIQQVIEKLWKRQHYYKHYIERSI